MLPLFTVKEIEAHRTESGKQGRAVMKTLDRGRKFKEERYLSSNDIFAAETINNFVVKGKCKASIKKETRHMQVYVDKLSGCVKIF